MTKLKMLEYVKNYLEQTYCKNEANLSRPKFRDYYLHSVRVLEWVKRINQKETGDCEIVEIAAIFHDVGKNINKKNHALISSQICEQYLTDIKYNQKRIKKIVEIIKIHSDKETSVEALAKESRILMDADLLDETGITVVLWNGMVGLSYNQAYEDILKHYQKLKLEERLLKTDTGKIFYQERLMALKRALVDLQYELMIN